MKENLKRDIRDLNKSIYNKEDDYTIRYPIEIEIQTNGNIKIRDVVFDVDYHGIITGVIKDGKVKGDEKVKEFLMDKELIGVSPDRIEEICGDCIHAIGFMLTGECKNNYEKQINSI